MAKKPKSYKGTFLLDKNQEDTYHPFDVSFPGWEGMNTIQKFTEAFDYTDDIESTMKEGASYIVEYQIKIRRVNQKERAAWFPSDKEKSP